MYVQDAQKLLARHAHRIANRQTEHSAVPGVQADLEIRMIQRPDKFQDRLRRGVGQRQHRHIFMAYDDTVLPSRVRQTPHELVIHAPEPLRVGVLVISEGHDGVDDHVGTPQYGGSADGFDHFLKPLRTLFLGVVLRRPAPRTVRLADLNPGGSAFVPHLNQLFCVFRLRTGIERRFGVRQRLVVQRLVALRLHAAQPFPKPVVLDISGTFNPDFHHSNGILPY